MCQIIKGKSTLSYCWANVTVSKTPITAGFLATGIPLSCLYLFWFHASPTSCIITPPWRPSTLLPDSGDPATVQTLAISPQTPVIISQVISLHPSNRQSGLSANPPSDRVTPPGENPPWLSRGHKVNLKLCT